MRLSYVLSPDHKPLFHACPQIVCTRGSVRSRTSGGLETGTQISSLPNGMFHSAEIRAL